MAAVTELASGIWQASIFPYVNVFLLSDPDGLTIVDTGLKRSAPKVLDAVRAVGRRAEDVRRVVLTHLHLDHAGSLAALKERVGAEVLAHDEDASLIEQGRTPPPDPAVRGMARLIVSRTKPVAPARVDRRVSDGEVLPVAGGTRVLHTPGHSPGHLSLLVEREGLLITGDALFNVRGLTYSPRFFCSNIALSRQTVERLGDLDYDSVAFAHGRPIRGGGRDAVRDFIRRRRGS